MSQVTACRDCKHDVSATARKSPHCGSKTPTNYSIFQTAFMGGLVMVFTYLFFSALGVF